MCRPFLHEPSPSFLWRTGWRSKSLQSRWWYSWKQLLLFAKFHPYSQLSSNTFYALTIHGWKSRLSTLHPEAASQSPRLRQFSLQPYRLHCRPSPLSLKWWWHLSALAGWSVCQLCCYPTCHGIWFQFSCRHKNHWVQQYNAVCGWTCRVSWSPLSNLQKAWRPHNHNCFSVPP